MSDEMFQNAVEYQIFRYISVGIYTLKSPNLSKHSFPRYQACLGGSSKRPTVQTNESDYIDWIYVSDSVLKQLSSPKKAILSLGTTQHVRVK